MTENMLRIRYEDKQTEAVETIEIPDMGEDSDTWDCIAAFDEANGTDYWDKIDTDNIIDVEIIQKNGNEMENTIELGKDLNGNQLTWAVWDGNHNVENVKSYKTRKEAFDNARYLFDHLTKEEKKRGSFVKVVKVAILPDGELSSDFWDTIDMVDD
ncbi:MAG: hypothetical protein M0P07_04765 [Candidatus Methanomethylophilaceae archaeon]|nr:hypothetical protein [Candidatus Methanomethylophilaceae archaeon]MDY0246348.1 hypothetical protein [Methanosarcina mazei]